MTQKHLESRRPRRDTTRSPTQWPWLSHVVAGLLLLPAACNTTPTFTPGSGTTFGTLGAPDGLAFTMETDGADNLSRVRVSDGSSFAVDKDGQVTNWTAPDGSTYDFSYSGDQVTVNFDIVDQGTGAATFDLGASGKSKLRLDTAADVNPFCERLSQLCAAIVQFLDSIVPVIVDQITDAIAADSLIPRELIRIGVQAKVNEAVQPIYDFCAFWQLLVLVDNPRDTSSP
ncbi:MAG: hypothetical protein KDA33_09250 [Phycisphaerales bacterium]|nr:hypothetical protein [Phycisphaerales bacterium]